MNRVQADVAEHFTAVDYALAFSAATHFRRALQSVVADGWDLLLTPTVAELPITLGTIVERPGQPDGGHASARSSSSRSPRRST